MRDEASGKLWFLKFNARPSPIAHLGPLVGGDLCAALLAAVTNAFPIPPKPFKETTVALFPQDWARDPEAADRGTDHLDLPVDDERLQQVLMAQLRKKT